MKQKKAKIRSAHGRVKADAFTLIELLVSTYCLYPRKLV